MEKEIKEEKELVLVRVPPGDRWKFAASPAVGKTIYPSLTDALEAWYQQNGDTNFYIEARKGTVEIIRQEEVEVEIKRFSLYGED